MSSDSYTSDELERLEKRIQKEYKKAEQDLTSAFGKYIGGYTDKEGVFHAGLNTRYHQEYAAYLAGKYTDQQFIDWYISQVGRGERFEELSQQMAHRLNDAAIIAQNYTNGILPNIYTVNSNSVADIASKSAMDNGVVGIRFDLIDEHTIRRLMTDSSAVKPFEQIAINLPRQYSWNINNLQNALLQGILQGDSIDHLADRMQSVVNLNRVQAVRNARTAVTGAQSAGKQDRFEDLAEQGVHFTKIWVATDDERTRIEHEEADGQEVEWDEPFEVGGEELMHPGDINGSPWNIYNCRCTMKTGRIRFESILGGKAGAVEVE